MAAFRIWRASVRASVRSLLGGRFWAFSNASIASASRSGSGNMVGFLLLTCAGLHPHETDSIRTNEKVPWRRAKMRRLASCVRNWTLAGELSFYAEIFLPRLPRARRARCGRGNIVGQARGMGRSNRHCGTTAKSLDGKLQPGRDWRIEVTDEFANPLYVFSVSAKRAI
jgi:hypothetical protein